MDTLTEGASQEKAGLSLVGDMEVGERSQQCSGMGKQETLVLRTWVDPGPPFPFSFRLKNLTRPDRECLELRCDWGSLRGQSSIEVIQLFVFSTFALFTTFIIQYSSLT